MTNSLKKMDKVHLIYSDQLRFNFLDSSSLFYWELVGYGSCVYTYPEKNFRQCPGIARNAEHWDNLYRHRTLVERTIKLFKEAFGLNYLKTQSAVSAKFDLYLAGCTQLIGVILAEAINKSSLFRSVRKIVKLVSCA